jgi:hypothetical protein
VLQEGCTYTVSDTLKIREGATLHVRSGVEIEFSEEAPLSVNEGAAISAQGTLDIEKRPSRTTPTVVSSDPTRGPSQRGQTVSDARLCPVRPSWKYDRRCLPVSDGRPGSRPSEIAHDTTGESPGEVPPGHEHSSGSRGTASMVAHAGVYATGGR